MEAYRVAEWSRGYCIEKDKAQYYSTLQKCFDQISSNGCYEMASEEDDFRTMDIIARNIENGNPDVLRVFVSDIDDPDSIEEIYYRIEKIYIV